MVQSGKKYDDGKPDYSLVPFPALTEIVKVLEFGAKKYGRFNWSGLSNFRARYFAACMRHLAAWACGEENDEESGLPHLAHAGCCLMFLLSEKSVSTVGRAFSGSVQDAINECGAV